MQSHQIVINSLSITDDELKPLQELEPQLVLVFASLNHFSEGSFSNSILQLFPSAQCVGCSTAGEISQQGVSDHTAIITGIRFQHPDFVITTTHLATMDDSLLAGQRLGQQLLAQVPDNQLHSILLLGQGVAINGSALIAGVQSAVPASVTISGGLAGDAGNFSQSFVLTPQQASTQALVAIGFYGPHIRLGHGSFGGWQTFGPARRVTRHSGNILYELDGKPALDLYKEYLGDYAKDLPTSGLLFPFAMLGADHQEIGLIRTILGINEQEGSLILAGDILADGYLQLMHASADALINGAQAAAESTLRSLSSPPEEGLAILVSCIGRKLVLGGQVDDEIESVTDVFGTEVLVTGFYSNGEISPFLAATDCRLHNQTMTITYLSEQ